MVNKISVRDKVLIIIMILFLYACSDDSMVGVDTQVVDNLESAQINEDTQAEYFLGVFEFNGPLVAYTQCENNINRRWASNCDGFPIKESARDIRPIDGEDPSIHCIPDGIVRINMRSLYDIQMWSENDDLIIKYQFGDIIRRININGPPPPEGTPHTLHGYSVGQWRGDTLYIETTHLSESFFLRDGGPTSSEAKVIERWWPGPSGDSLLVDIILDDPTYYDEPFLVQRREWRKSLLDELEPWNCVSAAEILLNDDPDLDAFFE